MIVDSIILLWLIQSGLVLHDISVRRIGALDRKENLHSDHRVTWKPHMMWLCLCASFQILLRSTLPLNILADNVEERPACYQGWTHSCEIYLKYLLAEFLVVPCDQLRTSKLWFNPLCTAELGLLPSLGLSHYCSCRARMQLVPEMAGLSIVSSNAAFGVLMGSCFAVKW